MWNVVTWPVEYPAMVRLFQYFIEDIGIYYLTRRNANSVIFRINGGIWNNDVFLYLIYPMLEIPDHIP